MMTPCLVRVLLFIRIQIDFPLGLFRENYDLLAVRKRCQFYRSGL